MNWTAHAHTVEGCTVRSCLNKTLCEQEFLGFDGTNKNVT